MKEHIEYAKYQLLCSELALKYNDQVFKMKNQGNLSRLDELKEVRDSLISLNQFLYVIEAENKLLTKDNFQLRNENLELRSYIDELKRQNKHLKDGI